MPAERRGGEWRVGPASLRGLVWLARVGPAPVEGWGCAMGWSRAVAFDHARRLQNMGWVSRSQTVRGEGALLVATAAGVRMSAVPVTPAPAPAPTSWAHLLATGWVAAWLSARGREMVAPRELLVDPAWRGEISWRDGRGQHESGHRPDLAGGLPAGGLLPIEVELQWKSKPRLRAVLALYAKWIAGGKTGAVMYVCSDQRLRDRVIAAAGELGLAEGAKTLRVELLEDIRREAVQAWKERDGAGR